jgi:hypothetical protein
MSDPEGVDLSQGIAGHPELTLIAIVDDEGQVILVGNEDQNQTQPDQGETQHV